MSKKLMTVLTVLLLIFLIISCQQQKYNSGNVGIDQIKPQVKETSGIPILMYHKVNSNPLSGGYGLRVPAEKFAWQMKYLYDNGYHTITLQDMVDNWQKGKKLPAKPIVITFDDGYQDNYTEAYPILRRYKFKATIFVATNYVGSTNRWDVTNGQPSNKMLTWDEIRKLQAGGINIEAHTMSHPHLTKIPPEKASQEMVRSKIILEKRLGKKVNFLAYPYGDNNMRIRYLAKEDGFTAAVVTDPQGKVNAWSNLMALKRVRIMGHYNNQTFVNVLTNPVEGAKLYLKKPPPKHHNSRQPRHNTIPKKNEPNNGFFFLYNKTN